MSTTHPSTESPADLFLASLPENIVVMIVKKDNKPLMFRVVFMKESGEAQKTLFEGSLFELKTLFFSSFFEGKSMVEPEPEDKS